MGLLKGKKRVCFKHGFILDYKSLLFIWVEKWAFSHWWEKSYIITKQIKGKKWCGKLIHDNLRIKTSLKSRAGRKIPTVWPHSEGTSHFWTG